MNADDWRIIFRLLWKQIHPACEDDVLNLFREILSENDPSGNLYATYEELEEAARKQLNMVPRDDVRMIASDELGMIDGPGEER